jgi:hypothetical protein
MMTDEARLDLAWYREYENKVRSTNRRMDSNGDVMCRFDGLDDCIIAVNCKISRGYQRFEGNKEVLHCTSRGISGGSRGRYRA